MNILTCAGAFDTVSGYNTAIRRLAAEFRNLGHRSAVLCRKPPAVYSADETADDFLVVPARDFLGPRRARLFGALDAFRPDVVFTHNIDLTDQAGFRYARRKGLPVFSMCHTRYRHYIGLAIPWKGLRFPLPGRVFEWWVVRRLRQSETVFALTEDMKGYLENLGLRRVVVAGGGVSPAFSKAGRARPDTAESGSVRLLFVGQIRAMKNQMFLLEMSRFLPPGFRLDLVGGKCWDRVYHRRFLRACRSGRYPNAAWRGELPPGETAEYFRAADVYVSASLLEVQSLTQVEAMASGLPTVRLHGPRTNGVTVHLETAVHLDETASPREFAAAVVRLVGDRRLYGDLRKRALAEAARYSWRSTAERILEAFAPAVRALT